MRLMDPALFKVFAQEFAAEWNKLQADAELHLDRGRGEHQRVCSQIDRLVDALADGEPAQIDGSLKSSSDVASSSSANSRPQAPAPRLHPTSRRFTAARSRSCTAP